VIQRFGKYVGDVQLPGLRYHLPYPIETAQPPKALHLNKIDIGMHTDNYLRRGTRSRDMPEESLMLTGDENIVDVDFSVLWVIKPGGVSDYVLNIQNPEGTVKAVAESATREVIGQGRKSRVFRCMLFIYRRGLGGAEIVRRPSQVARRALGATLSNECPVLCISEQSLHNEQT
jgi:regulator of protease activity HflC (stomatin/prohibitin superfamily)